jgi:hypothetical protein
MSGGVAKKSRVIIATPTPRAGESRSNTDRKIGLPSYQFPGAPKQGMPRLLIKKP